uniref:proline-rich protein 36-like n=1 Tax=Erigeron canadensis TaxID=72917 RepID=UPI001CB8F228|nr:proline-rich protein 36-like [Erigeron canadensis]
MAHYRVCAIKILQKSGKAISRLMYEHGTLPWQGPEPLIMPAPFPGVRIEQVPVRPLHDRDADNQVDPPPPYRPRRYYQAYDDPHATATVPPLSPGHIVPPQSSTCVSCPTLSDPPTPYSPPGFEPIASPVSFEPTAPLNPDFTTPQESPDDGLRCI